ARSTTAACIPQRGMEASSYPQIVAQATALTGAENVRWDLSDLFKSPTDPAIEQRLAASFEAAQEFEQAYRGKVATLPPAEFAEMMAQLEDQQERAMKPEIYAYLLHSQNTQDPAAGRLLARVREAAAERGSHAVFFDLELAQITDAHAAELFAHPEAAKYRHHVEEARKFRPHQLTEPEERVLTDFSPVGNAAWVRLFEELSAGIRMELDGRLRHFPTWISSRNLANETSDAAVEALVHAVTSRYDTCVRYYRVKRKLMGLDELHEWDRYAPVAGASRDMSWNDAKDLVLGSYQRFSPRIGELIGEFFENGWIDAPVLPNKQGGAYCMPVTPKHHPYVMLNYTGKLRDALVIAHELGHGLHDRLAVKQNLFDYHPPLTLAETASVFGEQLTFDAIMAQEKDPKIRLGLLCAQCEDAFATVFRQVAFNRFEDAAHTARRTEGELAPEQLGELFQDRLQAMFGDALTLTDEHKVWWSYVGHFIHTPGYVYAYAFGNLLALAVYHRYLEQGAPFVEKYIDFLAAGGSTRPDELVRGIGMDITDPGFWDAGLTILDNMVREV